MMLRRINSKLIAWLRLARLHTAILETPLAILGAALALGEVFTYAIIPWIVLGALYHAVGYGMNSYADWVNGFDKNDPDKQHHPLNTGEITPKQAKYAIWSGFIILLVYALWLGSFTLEAFLVLSIMIAGGVGYNYFGKYTEHKYLLISLAHTGVFFYPYAVIAESVSLSAILGIIAIFVHHTYQIAISGDVKDIESDESSLIERYGVKLEVSSGDKKRLYITDKAAKFRDALLFIETALVVLIVFMQLETQMITAINFYIVFLLIAGHTITGIAVLEPDLYDRDDRLRKMSLKEMFGFWMIIFAYSPTIGLKASVTIIVASVIYLLVMNRYMWSTWLKPDV